MPSKRQKLGEILLEVGCDRPAGAQGRDAKVAEGSRKKIGEVLVELGSADEDSVAKALAKQHNMEFVDLTTPRR